MSEINKITPNWYRLTIANQVLTANSIGGNGKLPFLKIY